MRKLQRILRFESLGKRELMAADLGVELETSSLVSVVDDTPLVDKSSGFAKIATSLVNLFYQEQQPGGSLKSGRQENAGILRRNGGLVAVDLITKTTTEELINDTLELGLTAYSTFGRLVSGWLPVTSIAKLSTLETLQFARSGTNPISNAGNVSNQSSRALGGDTARQRFGVDGSGVTVGILSDSFNSRGGYASDIASGDLPSDVRILRDFAGGSDEGRAMAQLIADIAPSANLVFRTAFGGVADFANGILELAAAGSDIIVDDVLYLAEPMFQDGIVAQAVNQVVSQGVTYFSSAGNSGRDSYESVFRDSGQVFTINGANVGRLHDFDPGNAVDVRQRVRLGVGQTTTISFQWDQPFFSAGGQGSQSDYDIYILAGNRVVASSRINNIGGDAVELLSFTNSGQFGTTQFDVMIGLASGPAATRVKYVAFGGTLDIVEFDTNSSTTYGQANAAGAIPVGAAFFANTPNFGNAPQLQPFSSAVGTPILFTAGGTRLATPQIRQRLVVGTDGGNTTFFGSDIAQDTDSFPNFFGTSAAAPNVAAIAALMLDANSSLSPQDIYQTLRDTAIDFNQVGFDNDSGFGLVDGLAAVQRSSNVQGGASNTSTIVNGSFESGLSGWDRIGDARVVNSSFGVPVANGSSQALLTTANSRGGNQTQASIESFLSLSAGRLEPIAAGDAIAGSAIRQTVQAKRGETLTFNASFLTNESTPSSLFNDFAFVSISGQGRQQVFLISDTTSGGFASTISAGFRVIRNGSQVSISLDADGTFVIGFGVLDSGDTNLDSALVIDSIRFLPSTVQNFARSVIAVTNRTSRNGLVSFAAAVDGSAVDQIAMSNPTNGAAQMLITAEVNTAGSKAIPELMTVDIAFPEMQESIALIATVTSSITTESIVVHTGDTPTFDFTLQIDEAQDSCVTIDGAHRSIADNPLFEVPTIVDALYAEIANSPTSGPDFLGENIESPYETGGEFKGWLDGVELGLPSFDSADLNSNLAFIALATTSLARLITKTTRRNKSTNALFSNPTIGTLDRLSQEFAREEMGVSVGSLENGTSSGLLGSGPSQACAIPPAQKVGLNSVSMSQQTTVSAPQDEARLVVSVDPFEEVNRTGAFEAEQDADKHVHESVNDLALIELFGS